MQPVYVIKFAHFSFSQSQIDSATYKSLTFSCEFQMAVGISDRNYVSDTRDSMKVFYTLTTSIEHWKYKNLCMGVMDLAFLPLLFKRK